MDTTNKPVAWMSNDSFEISTMQSDKFSIPLYTHPNQHDLGIAEAVGFDKGYNAAKPADLTDEQILCLWDWWSGEDLATNVLDFADTYRRALSGEAGLVEWHEKYVERMNNEDPAWKATQE